MSRIAHDFHHATLRCGGGVTGIIQLDEMESFEEDRRLKPLTIAVAMERRSFFVFGADVGTLPPRGNLRPKDQERKIEAELADGLRFSQSDLVVRRAFRRVDRCLRAGQPFHLQSDKKLSYWPLLKECSSRRPLIHETVSSKERRDHDNLIFPVNHVLARMRDGISCMVRRNWANAKRLLGMQRHVWIWIVWQNYVRTMTVKVRWTPAQKLRLVSKRMTMREIFYWRWPMVSVA